MTDKQRLIDEAKAARTIRPELQDEIDKAAEAFIAEALAAGDAAQEQSDEEGCGAVYGVLSLPLKAMDRGWDR